MIQPSCPRCNYPLNGLMCQNCGYFYQPSKLKDKKKKKKKLVN